MENKYWLLEPLDSYLDINQDDIDEMKYWYGEEEEEELDAMTLAKAKREEEMLEEERE